MLSVSVIICTKDRMDDLRRCLDSLAAQTRPADELIVVDAGGDGVEEVVHDFESQSPRTRVEYLRSSPGLTRQRNLGVAHATKDIVQFLDDDIILDDHYIESILATFDDPEHDDVIGVNPRVEQPEGPPRTLGRIFRRCFLLVRTDGPGRLQPSGFGTLTSYSGRTDLHPVDVACGCCAYRRRVFDRIRFDQFFDGYGRMEDVDFSVRARQHGRILCNPNAHMLHLASPAGRTDGRRLAKMFIVNHWYVFHQHVPKTWRSRLCFWWSEVGENAIRLRKLVRTGDWGIVLGTIEGYRAILKGEIAAPPAEARHDR